MPASAERASVPRTRPDEWLAVLALVAMVLVPLIELSARPMLGAGVQNAAVLVQHLVLLMSLAGAVAAERHGHLVSLGVHHIGQTPERVPINLAIEK